MHKPRANITLKGTFPHERYEQVCEALRELGDIYSSMCSVESTMTVAMASLHSCSSESEIEAVIRAVLRDSVIELRVDVEEANAEACN